MRLIVGALLVLALVGCGSDDGTGVRELDGSGNGSGSASGSGSGSGSGAGSGSAAGSGSGASSGSASGASADCPFEGAEQAVPVTLDEWEVAPAEEELSAGTVTFAAENAGEQPHELYVVRAEDPADLPKAEGGEVAVEQLEEGALLGEIEPFPAGQTCTGSFELEAGTYTLFCNIVSEADGSHYENGMVTTVTVQ